jgi:sec-independent protein translocase protein TatC
MLLKILNRLVEHKELADASAIEEAVDDSATSVLLDRRNSLNEEYEIRWLNRALLAAVFAGELAPPAAPFAPIFLWRDAEDDPRTKLTTLGTMEPFMVYMKSAMIAGLVIAGPWVFYQLWVFVAAGLYPHERKYVYVFLPWSIGLFLLGVATVFLLVFEPVLNFLVGFNRYLGLSPDPRMNEFLSWVLLMPLGFGIAFQLPLVMLFLNRIGIFSVEAYVSKWRIAVLTICIISAILTPADPWSMMFMAAPLCFLYVFGIFLCKWRRQPARSLEAVT